MRLMAMSLVMVLNEKLWDHWSYFNLSSGDHECLQKCYGNPSNCCQDIFNKNQLANSHAARKTKSQHTQCCCS